MLIVCGHVIAPPNARDEIMALAIEHSVRSRAEQGCIAHNCCVDAEDAGRIVFVERWHDVAALRAHFSKPESVAFVAAMREMSADPPAMQILDANEVSIGE